MKRYHRKINSVMFKAVFKAGVFRARVVTYLEQLPLACFLGKEGILHPTPKHTAPHRSSQLVVVINRVDSKNSRLTLKLGRKCLNTTGKTTTTIGSVDG